MNGSYYQRFPIKIGIVCDRFYFEAIEDAADFVYLSPNVDDKTLSSLDLLLVVSAWRGLENDEWAGMLYDGRATNLRIKEIIDFCKRSGKKTVFLSKEDPPNYDYCVGLAKCCDYVFTTAEECVPYYVKACKHNRVYVTGFCINPRYHNPIGMRREPKRNAVVFAGSWMEKYPQRCRDLEMMFDGVIASGYELTVYDRNYYKCGKPQYWYPKKYQSWSKPAIDHLELQRVHHAYDWAININTVRRSFSMFANRVYELQANGSLLLSNANPGMIRKFPDVFVIRSAEAVKSILEAFSEEERYALQIKAIRRVMSSETCYERISEILKAIGIKIELPRHEVLVIVDDCASCQDMFENQTYPYKRLIAKDKVCESDLDGVEYVAFFSSALEYDPHYLEDTINAFKYADAAYVTSGLSAEHEPVSSYNNKARTVFRRECFTIERLLSFGDEAELDGGYSIDRFCCGKPGEWRKFMSDLACKRSLFAAEILPEDLPGETPEFSDWLKRRQKWAWAKKLPFPLNKLAGGIRCLEENGLRYTLLHIVDKLRGKLA